MKLRLGKKETNTEQCIADGNAKSRNAKSSPKWMSEARYGRSISLEFFKQNAWLLLIIVVAVIALIGLRYKTKTKMAEIKRLNVELARAESYKLQQKSAYMSLIRETEMRKMVRERGLSLEFQEAPPYELIDE
ncbi:MAG: FtsL-like putative cell division protein [Candidatus Amulumruptor caecigallinarius]|nr:FtsL-like putative cell division protein [Candidatus Amulumruptor caecigallinarius]